MTNLTNKYNYLPSEIENVNTPTVDPNLSHDLNWAERKSILSNKEFCNTNSPKNVNKSTSTECSSENQEKNDIFTNSTEYVENRILFQNNCTSSSSKSGDRMKLFLKKSDGGSKTEQNTSTSYEPKCEEELSHASSFPFSQYALKKYQDDNSSFDAKDTNECILHSSDTKLKLFSKQSARHVDEIKTNPMKTKIRSMWNNVKYGWRVKREVNLKVDSAVWLLGRCYHNKLTESSSLSQDVSKQLKIDVLSKIWLTYRMNFQAIPGTQFVTDSGWGCMLRCGQMMMAQALICHFLSRDWRSSDESELSKHYHKKILRWFGDSSSNENIFSLHHLVHLGKKYGRKPGDWYGPTHVAQVLRDALFISQENNPLLKDICMYVALDGIVFKQDVEDLCKDLSDKNFKNVLQSSETELFSCSLPSSTSHNTNSLGTQNSKLENNCDLKYMADAGDPCPSYSEFGPPSFNSAQGYWKSLILFVSVRLGNDRMNPFYVPCLKSLLAYEHCIGVIGGRPKHALYFIGWQDDKLIHLDPHACQPVVDVEKEDFSEKSFHSSTVRTINFSEMDPSCAIGFYFKTQEQYYHFVEKFTEITAPLKKNMDYPIFALVDGKRSDIEEIDSSNAYASSSFSSMYFASQKEDDDYILL